MSEKDDTSADIQGEGNYDAAEEYDEGVRRFVKSGKVDQAARDAAPHDEAEEREMEQAEDEGRSHARGSRSEDCK